MALGLQPIGIALEFEWSGVALGMQSIMVGFRVHQLKSCWDCERLLWHCKWSRWVGLGLHSIVVGLRGAIDWGRSGHAIKCDFSGGEIDWGGPGSSIDWDGIVILAVS